jgi:microcystin-dependent protein
MAPTKVAAQEGFIGEVKLFAGNYAPRNWAFCDGQLLPISQNQALFSIVGTLYGGDGRTTFALPDLRGRVPVGVGAGPGLSTVNQGQKQGAETITLTTSQLPSHEHKLENVAEVDIKSSPVNNNHSKTEAQKVLTPVTTAGATTVTTTNSGGSQPISIKPPSLGLRYIICIIGIFPSRS